MLTASQAAAILPGIQPNNASSPKYRGVGYAWNAHSKPIAHLLTQHDTAGLYVLLPTGAIEKCVNGIPKSINPVFPLGDDGQLKTPVRQINNGIGSVDIRWLDGWLNYTDICLKYIYATASGKQLLDGLQNELFKANLRVNIVPRFGGGNQIAGSQGFSEAYQWADNGFQFTASEVGRALKQHFYTTLQTVSRTRAQYEQLAWLASKLNNMPLYSVYDVARYPQGFLRHCGIELHEFEIEEWFKNGHLSKFHQRFNGQIKEGVDLLQFIKLATIIMLYEHAPAGKPVSSTLQFDATVSETNGNRPPAIGLAHELIHAYYYATGRQPGSDLGYTQVAYELLCTGIEPWADKALSDNGIRAQWPPATIPVTDTYNRKSAPPRTVYTPTPADQIIQARQQRGGI